MIKITFPDGAVREFESGVTTFEIAQSISNSLAKKALAGKFNGKLIDTTRAITENYILKELTIGNVIIFSPLVTFIVSLFYSYRFKFSVWWLIGVGLLFCFTIITFGEFIHLYLLAYEIFALAGMAVGVAIKNLVQKLKRKKLSQNP